MCSLESCVATIAAFSACEREHVYAFALLAAHVPPSAADAVIAFQREAHVVYDAAGNRVAHVRETVLDVAERWQAIIEFDAMLDASDGAGTSSSSSSSGSSGDDDGNGAGTDEPVPLTLLPRASSERRARASTQPALERSASARSLTADAPPTLARSASARSLAHTPPRHRSSLAALLAPRRRSSGDDRESPRARHERAVRAELAARAEARAEEARAVHAERKRARERTAAERAYELSCTAHTAAHEAYGHLWLVPHEGRRGPAFQLVAAPLLDGGERVRIIFPLAPGARGTHTRCEDGAMRPFVVSFR